jgi:Putative Zn-dependent protease, contains TPR repeats
MNLNRFSFTSSLVAGLLLIAWAMVPARLAEAQSGIHEKLLSGREDAYRANNLGVALLEQYDYKSAAEYFRRALALKPDLQIAQVNLAISLYNAQDYDSAVREAKKASEMAPDRPQPFYILGLIARAQNRAGDALDAFRRVLQMDPADVGANVNLGQIYIQGGKYASATPLLREAVKAEPYNSTALYSLATVLLRQGVGDEAQQLLTRFQALRQSGAATSIGQNYLEQGHYSEALVSTGAETELVDRNEPKVFFQDIDVGLPNVLPYTLGNINRTAALIDFDGDGDLDLVETGPASMFRNDGGKFIDVTNSSGDFAKVGNLAAYSIIAGDFDNDGKADLFVSWKGRLALYRNMGGGKFEDATNRAKIPVLYSVYASAFADVDHDGDIDIVLNSSAKATNFLLRNNGDGTFTDISVPAGVNQRIIAEAIVPTDYDNRRDLDLMFISADRSPLLLRNLRNGSFENVADMVGLETHDKISCVAVGDFNKDSYVDFFFGRQGKPGILAASDGRGKFVLSNAPRGTNDATSALFLDYDNDGLLDLLVSTPRSLAISRNLGDSWTKATTKPFKTTLDSSSKQILAADLDSDGDPDLLVYAKNGTLRLLRNTGGEANSSQTVNLFGRVSNRLGIGAKVELRAGSLTQKLENYSASPMPAPAQILFGLGKREKPDAVRIIWPSGVVQAETEFSRPASSQFAAHILRVEELDRKPSSCPYLYTWNGDKFEFITDFMGGGEMGDWQGAGVYDHPNPEEFVRIAPGKLKPRNGKYEIRVTNELEEVLFIDQLKLFAVEHDADTEVYPNEGLGIPTAGKHILYTTRNEHEPLSAVDGKGGTFCQK